MATFDSSRGDYRPSGPRKYLRFSLWTLLLVVTGFGLFLAGRASVTPSLLEAKHEAARARMQAEKAEQRMNAFRESQLRWTKALRDQWSQRVPVYWTRSGRRWNPLEGIEGGMKASAWEHQQGYPQLQPYEPGGMRSPRFPGLESIPLDNP